MIKLSIDIQMNYKFVIYLIMAFYIAVKINTLYTI